MVFTGMNSASNITRTLVSMNKQQPAYLCDSHIRDKYQRPRTVFRNRKQGTHPMAPVSRKVRTGDMAKMSNERQLPMAAGTGIGTRCHSSQIPTASDTGASCYMSQTLLSRNRQLLTQSIDISLSRNRQ